MSQPIQYSLPLAFNKYIALTLLKKLSSQTRLTFDEDTYVIRRGDYYVAYRTWMKAFPLIEVFYPGSEPALVDWLEQFGYLFESETFSPWISRSPQNSVDRLNVLQP